MAATQRPRDAIAAALDAAIHSGGAFDTAEGQAAIAVEALFAAGYKIVDPEHMTVRGWYSKEQGLWPHGPHVKPAVADAQGFVPVYTFESED